MTPAQQLGFFIRVLSNQGERFTGVVDMRFQFYAGILKESEVIGLQRRVDLQRLNESEPNKTIDKTESISYIQPTQ
jgi:hypothetical protein